ncbi:MAG: Carboxyl-terminal protease [Anaerolineae bacterium]|nr:MAG: Carboxyl-terminal protease [Anaerolineae bacterium]
MNRRFWLGLSIVIITLGCRTIGRWVNIQAEIPPPPSPSATLGQVFTPEPSPTPTIVPPTLTPSPIPPSPTATVLVTPSAQQLAIFEQLWQTVRDEYLYPDYNGADWEAIGAEYRQRVQAGMTDEAFYQAMDEMLAQLNDDHSVFLSPQEVAEEEAEYAGQTSYVGIGVLISAVPERQRATIILTFPNSPAEAAGLQAHDNILRADGQPILDEFGFLRSELLLGEPDTSVELIVQRPGESPRSLTLVRRPIEGALPVPYTALSTPKGKRIGYLLLASLADSTIDDQVEQALRELNRQGDLQGVILDNRQNSGGADTVARGVLSLFTSGRLGYFTNRHQERHWFEVRGKNVAGSATIPLVVLIGPDTVSFGEILAGVLQDQQRATLIGTPTEGNVELLWSYDFADGSRAWIAHDTFIPLNQPQADWEKMGIQPDLFISSNWDEVTLETDPVILAALEYFDQP